MAEILCTYNRNHEFEFTADFRGFEVSLHALTDNKGSFNENIQASVNVGDLYITRPYEEDDNIANIWGVVTFPVSNKTVPIYTATVTGISTLDCKRDEKEEIQELIKSWLADPEFITLVMNMATKTAELMQQ